MAWIYLFIASVFEIAWTFSLKFLDFKKIGAIRWTTFFSNRQHLLVLAPLLGYILFGLANVFFFSLSVKQIPTSTALAVWMGVAIRWTTFFSNRQHLLVLAPLLGYILF